MNINFDKLPRKALKNKQLIKTVLMNAEDKFYIVTFVYYNTGLIRFESAFSEFVTINFYTTSGTVIVEHTLKSEKEYHRNLNAKQINKIFNKNQKL